MKKLSPNEERAYNFIKRYIKRKGESPTRFEVGKALGYDDRNALNIGQTYLMRMKIKGWISYDKDKKTRNIIIN